jgi:protein-L-isoaspartate O-methyltransferase
VYDLIGDRRKGTMSEPRAVDPAAPESYAEEWRRQADVRADSLAGATELMLDMTGISEGMRVLDLGAGLGDQSSAAARRVGRSGAVLATDRDPAMLEGTREAVAKAGLTNVQTRVMDAQAIAVEPGSFDAVISRMMLMLLPEPAKMLAGAYDALKPGGRLGAVVTAPAERNAFLSVPLELARRAGGLPAPDPREPGLFALGAPGAAEELLRAAGFREVRGRAAVLPVRPPVRRRGDGVPARGRPGAQLAHGAPRGIAAATRLGRDPRMVGCARPAGGAQPRRRVPGGRRSPVAPSEPPFQSSGRWRKRRQMSAQARCRKASTDAA